MMASIAWLIFIKAQKIYNSLAYFRKIHKIYNVNKIFKIDKVKIKLIKSCVYKAFIFYFFSNIVIEGARTKLAIFCFVF